MYLLASHGQKIKSISNIFPTSMKESIAKPLIRLSQKQFHVLERYKFSIL